MDIFRIHDEQILSEGARREGNEGETPEALSAKEEKGMEIEKALSPSPALPVGEEKPHEAAVAASEKVSLPPRPADTSRGEQVSLTRDMGSLCQKLSPFLTGVEQDEASHLDKILRYLRKES